MKKAEKKVVFPSTDPEREELYFRHIDYIGYRRADGLWDIEGHFHDRRTVDCPCVDRGGMIQAGETFHEMLLTMTIDDDMVIRGLTVNVPPPKPFLKTPKDCGLVPDFQRNYGAVFRRNKRARICFLC